MQWVFESQKVIKIHQKYSTYLLRILSTLRLRELWLDLNEYTENEYC